MGLIDERVCVHCSVLERALAACGGDPMAGPLWDAYIQLETLNVRSFVWIV